MILNSAIDSRLGVDSSVMFEPTSTFETPSTSQLTALRRPPLIEMLTVLVRPTPTSSLKSLDTPGASVASWTKLRLFSGISLTCTEVIVVCSAAIGWTSDWPDVTSTVSATPPTRHVRIELQSIVDVQIDIPQRDGLKARQLERQLVGADRQQRRGVLPVGVGDDRARNAGVGVLDRHRDARQHRAGLVTRDACNVSRGFLR